MKSERGQAGGKHRPLEAPEAFAKLYDRSHLIVFRFIYGLHGGPAEEVEDLTAETFLRAWNARRSFDGSDEAALSWLLRIARNLVVDVYRKQKSRGVEQELTLDVPTREAGPEECALHGEQVDLLLSLMDRLPIQQREILVLRYVVNWPVKRIAGHLGLLDNTVSVNIRRALHRLKQNWPED